MPLPSLFISGDHGRAWSVPRAALYGAAVGALAAMFKAIAPPHEAATTGANLLEIAGAVLAFALLCAGAAALRNFIASRFIWPEIR